MVLWEYLPGPHGKKKKHSRQNVRQRKLERNFGDPAVGRRVIVRAAAGVLSSFRLNHQALSPPLFLRFRSVGALVSHQPSWLWYWSHDVFAGRTGRLSSVFSVSRRRRLLQIRRRWSLHPWRGSFLSSAVVGSSPRGVKAFTASRHRISSPCPFGFRPFSLIFSLRLVLGFFVFLLEESEALRWNRFKLHAFVSLGGCGELCWGSSCHGDRCSPV